MSDVEPPSPAPRDLAYKLDRLFQTVRPEGGRKEYTAEEVAAALRERGGPTISGSYVWQLRRGVKDNPTKRHLEALADFFGVPAAYFFDDGELAARVDAELRLLASMRDAGVRRVAARVAGLSVEGIEAIIAMIEHVRRLEGAPPIAPEAEAEITAGTAVGTVAGLTEDERAPAGGGGGGEGSEEGGGERRRGDRRTPRERRGRG